MFKKILLNKNSMVTNTMMYKCGMILPRSTKSQNKHLYEGMKIIITIFFLFCPLLLVSNNKIWNYRLKCVLGNITQDWVSNFPGKIL